ncbi:hypothetical protein [Burkholderia sp. Bp9031]|uniref:hypothetical protein n=1 Tax=Burkholderia sp. Bp9031 TaxID=2184566 RepID=UPI000F6012DF|nr:hypothetical protein [Burkholderia sp. Bp9031]
MKKLVLLYIVSTIAAIPIFAMAQQHPSSGADGEAAQLQLASAPLTKAQARAKARAERKEARRQARQARNAELQGLQKNGYGPQASPEQYPENLLNAERKSARQPKVAVPASTPIQ